MTEVRARRSTRARPTDDELLDAARAVFVERGYLGTTMHAVADRADSTKPTLYAHFGDKDALYLRLLQREAATCRRWLFAAYEANAQLDLAAQVEADTVAFFDWAAAEPGGFRLLIGDDPGRVSAGIREQLFADVDAQIADRICGYLDGRGRPATFDVGLLATILVAVPVSAARHALDAGSDLRAAAAVAAAFSASALAGLAGA